MCHPGHDTVWDQDHPCLPRVTPRTYIIKVGDDLIQQPQAFQALLVDIRFRVELFEIRDGGKHDADAVVGLVVQVLPGRQRKGSAPGHPLNKRAPNASVPFRWNWERSHPGPRCTCPGPVPGLSHTQAEAAKEPTRAQNPRHRAPAATTGHLSTISTLDNQKRPQTSGGG